MNQTPEQGQYIDKTKVSTHPLWPLEQCWIGFILPRVPKYLNTVNLTLATILWSGLLILFGRFGHQHTYWLWAVSGLIIAQYFTDSLDGAIGRYRRNGLVKWGHYMDHLLDFVFLCAIIISYQYLLPQYSQWFIVLFGLLGSLMISSYLMFGMTNKFQMSYGQIGMIEFRIGVIIINALIIFIGPGFLRWLLPFMSLVIFFLLIWGVYRAQGVARQMDLENKRISTDRQLQDQ
ncbi:MAG: hypothetical protein A2898_05275 [Candidatus Kerfeldbacteria bacterium RIFCSPLOWO2_01_FULL_48_11]|uniref:CDP-alcohol phosphatidyltransferase n=1 Tax=Candidatus Kerfeldbacteria bacterium RIFCSPLOWO2_01_FULL_48_11 TaxID=1798543 RepID=A0A1G2AZT7_9BACT|nr:MAG: hypothetical protein UY34_C0022G0031 [Parcubacteria group bacterium GW2011_GWA2_48_9]KKW16684.1 MAG: hypothetical protein UY52_C0001G0004 [Parcubacteria group bacterium GW2011_GWC2_49_9]OGY82418.1 MAG: hypothetical protein A2898_05275 [Candidatus Kerfeldbacteria bacterium RIFCSPLOWO2_01_FULL_48_11]HCJ52334.1 hypothetical protein [Candidatus Kerfeldbacteria bacterium]HCM67694.1 hypothetical protein [Candidatus Kerfeldbacteria bacterium]